MVCRSEFAAGILLIVLRSHAGTWQTHNIVAPWTPQTSALQCTSSKPPCLDSSLSFQLAFLPVSTIRRQGGLIQLLLIQLVAAYNSRALPQAASQLAPFNPSTRAGCNLNSPVEDLRRVFLLDLPQFQDRVHLTNPPPLVHHQPHSGILPPRKRPTLIGSLMASTQKRRGTLKLMPQFLS